MKNYFWIRNFIKGSLFMKKYIHLVILSIGFLMIISVQNEIPRLLFSKFEIIDCSNQSENKSESEETYKFSENFEEEFTSEFTQILANNIQGNGKLNPNFNYSIRHYSVYLKNFNPPPELIS